MTSRLVITVPGEPQSQDRRTRQLRAKDGRVFSGTYLLPETRKWREAILAGSDLVLVIAAYGFPAALAVGVMRAMEVKRG